MTNVQWLCWKTVIGMKVPLSIKVTIDQGNLVRNVVTKWNEEFLNIDHLMHDNWIVYFKTWSRPSLSSGRARTCRDQSNVWNSRWLLLVTLKFETKTLCPDTFAQVNLISVAPTLQNLRFGLRRRQSGKSKVPAKQRGSWPKVLKLKEHERATFFSPSENRCLPISNLKPEEREFVVDSGASMHMISKKDLSDAEMDTLTKSCSPTIVITANGEVHILDFESPRKHASSIVAWKALRWKRIFLWMDQWSKTTSHQKRDSDTLQQRELRSNCSSRLVKFVLWIFIDFKDTFETGE